MEEFLGLSVSTSNVNNKNEILETYKIDDALFNKEVVVHVHYKFVKEETTHAEKNIILRNHFQCLKKDLHQKLKKEHQQ